MEELYRAPPWRWQDSSARLALWRWWVRDPFQGARDLVPHWLLRPLPTPLVTRIGARLSQGREQRHPEASARARALLRQLRPGASEAEIAALLRAHWHHLGRTFAEFSVLHRFWAEGRIEVTGLEHLEAVRAAGRPLVVAGLHVGSWEALHTGLSGLGVRFFGIYQRLPNRFRMRIADAARNRIRRAGGPGVALAPTLGAVFTAHRLLESREAALLYYVDEYWEGRVHAPALGRPVIIEGNIARAVRLASATGAAVIPAYALRIGEDARFRLTFLPEVPIGPQGRGRAGILADIQALDTAIEPVIRAHPEQWMMLHAFRPDR